jgi:uncharacterized protein (TIRG00374 family)
MPLVNGSPPARRPRRRPGLFALLMWGIVAALLVWVLATVPLGDALAALARLRVWQIAVLMIGNAAILILFAARWWFILRALGHAVPYASLTSYRWAAYGITYFTPGSQFGGEPLQVYLSQRRHGLPTPTAITSVALERLLELVGNFTILAAGVVITLGGPLVGSAVRAEGIAASLGLLMIPVGFLAATWAGRHPITWLLRRLPARLRQSDRLQRLIEGAADSELQATTLIRQRPWTVVEAMLVSGVAWIAMFAEMWLAVAFLGLPLTPVQLVAVMTAARIAILLPSPGGLGTLEAGQVWVFAALGLDPALGLSLSLIVRLRDVLFAGAGLAWGAHLTSTTKQASADPSSLRSEERGGDQGLDR